MTRKLVAVLISAVIGLALLPLITEFSGNLTQAEITDTDASVIQESGAFYGTTTGSLIDLLPILFVILLVVGMVAYVAISSKREA
jgi:multisubunit Na+/H+ antiporter MnhB subunit